jgi:MFS family permease
VLIAGWLAGIPVPFVLMWAPAWGWVIAGNVFLGINQGLAWSMTVNMKMDLVGPRRRGLALGLNEAAGYLAVAGAAFATGLIAERYGLRPEPFYIGIAFVALGLALSVLFVRDTSGHLALEAASRPTAAPITSLRHAFAETTWRRPQLFGASQAGFVNNLNDGLAWGIFPLFFASRGLELDRIAILAALYPLVWGSLQIATGWLSDQVGRKPAVVSGMVIQGGALWLAGASSAFEGWLAAVVLLGIGTALVYPALLAAIGDAVAPEERATSIGVYRFWRDGGAVAGALAAGALADLFGFGAAIYAVAALTAASGMLAAATLHDIRPGAAMGKLES